MQVDDRSPKTKVHEALKSATDSLDGRRLIQATGLRKSEMKQAVRELLDEGKAIVTRSRAPRQFAAARSGTWRSGAPEDTQRSATLFSRLRKYAAKRNRTDDGLDGERRALLLQPALGRPQPVERSTARSGSLRSSPQEWQLPKGWKRPECADGETRVVELMPKNRRQLLEP